MLTRGRDVVTERTTSASRDATPGTPVEPRGTPAIVRKVVEPAATTDTDPQGLRGRVVDIDDAPIVGAQVALAEDEGGHLAGFDREEDRAPTLARTSTDAAGRFAFAAAKARELRIDVSATGFTSAKRRRCMVGEEVVIRLTRGARIEGRVTDAGSGRPIEGAVIADHTFAERVTRSAADGSFRLVGFRPGGPFDLEARAAGYAARFLDLTTFAAVDHHRRVEVRLARGAQAHGVVLLPDGRPCEGADVLCTAELDIAAAQVADDEIRVRSSPGGDFVLEGLTPDADYDLVIRARDAALLALPMQKPPEQGGTLELGTLQFVPAATIAGVLTDRTGQPIADQTLYLHCENRALHGPGRMFSSQHARTDAQGRFRFGGVPAGPHRLSINRPVRASLALELHRGEHRDDLRFVVDVGLSIRGVVRSTTGAPLPSILVRAPHDASVAGSSQVAPTDRDGRFTLTGLRPGRWLLHAAPFGSRPYLAADLEVEAGAEGVVVELADAAALRGTLRDAEGAPLAGALVSVDGTPSERTAPDGSFAVFTAPGAPVHLRFLKLVPGEQRPQPIELETGSLDDPVFAPRDDLAPHARR